MIGQNLNLCVSAIRSLSDSVGQGFGSSLTSHHTLLLQMG